jgi:predicted ArsR family transcriptional regulator
MRDEDVASTLAKWPDEIKVSEEIRNQKYAICQSCEFFNAAEKKCTVCKCEMNLLTWSKYMGTCPKGKFRGE